MTHRTALAIAAFAASVVAPLALNGQTRRPQAAGGAAALTPIDYIEIQQLVARYPFVLDTGANNGYDYADLFASDGEFMRPYSRGREQLAALARGGSLGPSNVVHYITNHVIEPTADGAIGREYLFELGPPQAARGGGGGGQPANGWDLIGRRAGELSRTGGHYEDAYVKTAQGWRFKRREFIPSRSGTNPSPLNPPAIPATAPADAIPNTEHEARYISPTKQTSLEALDYIQIGQLVASYGHALDSGWGKGENGEAYANLYTPDAEFAGAKGHDALADLARIQPRGPDFVRHYLTNHVIEPAPGGAKGKEYLVVLDISENGMPGSIFLAGHYEDSYVRTQGGWRFKTRRLFPARPGQQESQSAAAAPVMTSEPAKKGKPALTAADYITIQQLVAKASYTRDQSKGPSYVHDFVANHVIQPSPGGATGRVYLVGIQIAEGSAPGAIENGGHYDDVYVKAPEGWRIKTRAYVPSKLGPREKFFWAPPAKTD